jgi:hypothetical protein
MPLSPLKKSNHMTIILVLIIVWISIVYIESNFLNTKLKQENQLLKDKCTRLEKDVRDQANKNIILESLFKQRNNNQNEDRRIY